MKNNHHFGAGFTLYSTKPRIQWRQVGAWAVAGLIFGSLMVGVLYV